MSRQLRSRPLMVALGLVASILVASPAAAFSPSGFESKVRCYNRTVSSDPAQIELRRLLVTPPKLYEKSASVGWRFIVHRSSNGLDWKVTYRSPVQRATTSSNFTSMDVKVDVPDRWPSPDPQAYPYRVVIKAFFYRADGSLKATSKAPVYEFRVWIDGSFAWRETSFCYGRTRLSE
jgi:hypothetical protein